MPLILKNNVSSTLTVPISASDTGIAVVNGGQFPALGAGDYFYATLVSPAGMTEIVKVTARAGNTMTVVRAQDGSSAASFQAGALVEMRVNAASIAEINGEASEISIADAGGYYTATDVEGALQEAAQAATVRIADAGGYYTATDVEGALQEAAQDTLSRANVAALLADTALSYSNVTAGDVIRTRAEGFAYEVAPSSATNHHVTTSGGVKLRVLPGQNGFASLLAFGATGVLGDDQDAAIVAAAGSGLDIEVPRGIYDFTSNLVLSRPWCGVSGGGGNVSSSNGSEMRFFGTGLAVNTRQTFTKIGLRSMASGQSGLRIRSGIGFDLGPARIIDFSDVGLEVGNTGTSGAYFIDVGTFEINNATRDGLVGFRITGGLPASNANVIRCPFIKGRWKKYAVIDGNANTIIGGDVEPNNSAVSGGVDKAIEISGVGNIWITPYIEPMGGGAPDVYIHFTSTARNNKLMHLYSPSGGSRFFSKVVDDGTGNEVDVRPVGENFSASIGLARQTQNLLSNAHFWNLKSDGAPQGWIKVLTGSATAERVTDKLRGAPYSIKLASPGDGRAILENWFSTHIPSVRGTLAPQPVGKLERMTVTAGVWCWSETPGFGAIKLFSGTVFLGTANHSGSGKWEFLTITSRMAPQSESGNREYNIQLRSNTSNVNSTGECWFTEPIVVFGTDIPQVGEARSLTDGLAQMVGPLINNRPITLAVDSATPSVAEGNNFIEANTEATTITNFTGGRNGQEIRIRTTSSNTTLANNSTIQTTTGAAKALDADRVYRLIRFGSKWFEG